MEVRKTLRAGEKGTKRWQAEYKEKLLNVRYRYDDGSRMRYTTVEIIVEEKPYVHSYVNGMVKASKKVATKEESKVEFAYIKIAYQELKERQQVKAAGGFWEKEKRLWKIDKRKVKELGIESRVIKCS